MNTLYVRCQTKDYILDIVAARAGMRIIKVNAGQNIPLYSWSPSNVFVCRKIQLALKSPALVFLEVIIIALILISFDFYLFIGMNGIYMQYEDN